MATAQSLPTLRPGDSVAGRFRIVEVIGKGGFSVVFRAYQESMQRYVALKVLKPSISDDESVIERFRREALFASHLSHPNTITLFDYGRTESGLCYIAMEYLEGTELGDVIRQREGLDLERVWTVLAQSAQSLAEAHRLELIHRDVKPENIFLVEQDDEELVKVLDFGLSKAFGTIGGGSSGGMTPLTQEGKVFGTPLYMAPEQAMDKPISPAIDIYALGHIGYAMITGSPRYGDMSTAMDIMLRQIYDPPLSLPEPYDDTPFADLIEACTHKDGDERIGDGDELFDALTQPEFKEYMPPGPLRKRLSERGAAHRDSGGGLARDSAILDKPDNLSFGSELERLHEILDEVRELEEVRIALINGPKGGGRTQLLHQFLDELDDASDLTVIHRQSFQDGAYETRGLTADIAQLQESGDELSDSDELFPALAPDDGTPSETADALARQHSAFFGNLDGKRETMLSKTGRLFRERAEQQPVVWALERLEQLDAFTLAFLNWFFQDLDSRPAPVFILATVSRSDLVDRAGLLRYTQAILGAAEPTVRRLFVSKRDGPDSHLQPEVQEISDTLTGSDMAVPDPIADAGDGDERRTTLQGGSDGEEDANLQALFDRTLGLLAQLGDDVSVETWHEVRDELLGAYDPQTVDFILDRAEQFGIVDRTDGTLRFGSPTFAERLRDQIDEVGAFDTETRRALAEALAEDPASTSREEIELAVHHLRQAGDLPAAIELLNRAGNEAFSILDLDAAREYYLRLQHILEETDEEELERLRDEIEAEPARIWLRIGEIHGALDEHGAAEDALEKAADHSEPHDPRIRGRALKLMADIQDAHDRHEAARASYLETQDAFEEADEPASALAAGSSVGKTLLEQGAYEEAVDQLTGLLDEAESLDLPLVLARTHGRLGRAQLRRGEIESTMEHLDRASEGFEALDHPKEAMQARAAFGRAAFAARRFELARDSYQKARNHAREVRRFDGTYPTLGLARSLAALGAYDRAADCIQSGDAPELREQTPLRKSLWARHRADLFFQHEAFPAALERYETMQTLAREIGRTDLVLSALIRKAFLHFHNVEYEKSAAVFEEAADRSKDYGAHGQYIIARASAVYLESASREFPMKNERLAEQLDKSVDGALDWATSICTLYLADVRAANGAWPPARELLTRSRHRALDVGRIRMLANIGHRLDRVDAIEADEEPPELAGSLIGGPLPPEIRLLRPDAIYQS